MIRGARVRFRLFWLLGILGVGQLALSPSARAEASTTEREPAEYRAVIGRAVREFDAGNFPEARGLFSKAHELYPNARTHLGLGFTAFELRNYIISVEHLEQALASTIKPLNAQLRKSGEDVLGRARDMIARVDLTISPSAGRVLVDGVPVNPTGDRGLVLEVGDHTVEVQAAGYLSERRTVRIVGGEKLDLKIALRQPELASAPVAPAQTPGQEAAPRDQAAGSARWYKSPWLWVSVGVVLVGGGVAAALLLRPDGKSVPNDPTVGDTTPSGGVFQSLRSW